ncbi:MAG: PE-PPE domain-containing protein [Mycobacterium sp.]
MSACRYVGRVGGLAVALGIGAAVFGAVDADAWADSSSPSAPVSAGPADGRSSHSAPVRARTPRPAAAQVTRRPAAASGRGAAVARTAVAQTAVAQTAVARPAAAALTQPVIMGPSGVPIPSDQYVAKVMNYYVRQSSGAPPQPPYEDPQPQVIFTPEGLYPITGVKSLPLNTSVDQGIQILYKTLTPLHDGTPTTVFGYSQSAIISGLLQSGYTTGGVTYNVPTNIIDTVDFVLVGNELNPNGGFLSRFTATPYAPALFLPSLGIPFYEATPADAYATTNYTLEYDGFADFPRYPLNLLADINAGLGLALVHTKYAPGPNCRTYCTTLQQVLDAIPLPVSPTSTEQNYFFMPTEDLPLLAPVRAIPLIGNPIADLVQPVLKAIVDLGYGDAAHGYPSGGQPPANVLVPFGLFPQVDPLEVAIRVFNGIGQGITDFINDFGPTGSVVRELSGIQQALSSIQLPNPASFVLPAPDSVLTGIQNFVTGVANAISYSTASYYSGLLPTADVANAFLTSLPGYSVSLFLGGVKQMIAGDLIGGLVNAIGLPIAANVGLVTTASLVVALSWAQAIAGVFGINLSA